MRKTIYILLATFGLIFSSCTEEIKIDLSSSEPELVVEGVITSDTLAHLIKITKSANYFSNQKAEGIRGAEVSLSDGFTEITLSESSDSAGIYSTPEDYAGIPGRTYTLTIKNADVNSDGILETYTASCPMNYAPVIDSMSVEKKRIFFQDAYAVRISMQDSIDKKNYYLCRTWINDICTSDSIDEWGITNDEFFNGKYLINESVMYLFPEMKPDEKVENGDRIRIEMCGITEDYLKFINEVVEEFRGRNPLFGGQPANIRTNIRRIFPESTDGKGTRGYFAAYGVARKETVYKE